MRTVIFYFSCVGLVLTLSLLGPLFVGVLAGEMAISQRFGFFLLIGGFLFGGTVLATLGRSESLSRLGGLVLLLLVWTVIPLVVALSIHNISELGFIDSYFEAVSGLTTTGSTTLTTVENWPQAVLFWRVQLQWLGGYLALLSIILILAPMEIGGLTSRREAVTIGADLKAGDDRLVVFIVNMAIIYASMTAFCFLAFFMTGTRAFYALTLAMTATSTGGFLPFDKGLDEVLNVFGLLVFGIFLLLGATSIFWQRTVISGRLSNLGRHRESYSVMALAGVLMVLLIYSAISASTGSDFSRTLVEGFLNGASLVATSGVESRPGYFTLLPLTLVLFVVLVGGCSFSTSGGLKHYRIGSMLVQSWSELDRLVYPSMVSRSYFGFERFDQGLMKAIWSFFVAAILVVGLGTILVATSGIPFEAALTASIATFSTAGPVYNSGWATPGTEAWPAYAAFSDPAKLALTVLMVLGRLEILAVVGLFSARYWRNR